jgi:DNA-binding NarL/FixJ family response regulator
MRKTRANEADAHRVSAVGIMTLVISQHEAVRRQLVTYLARSPTLAVSGDAFSPEAIVQAHPDVLVLDLSQLGQGGLSQAIDAAQRVGAHVIALASMRELDDEHAVTVAGGLYRLKSAGADGLAEIVQDLAAQPVSPAIPCAASDPLIEASGADRRSRPARVRTAAPRNGSRCKD